MMQNVLGWKERRDEKRPFFSPLDGRKKRGRENRLLSHVQRSRRDLCRWHVCSGSPREGGGTAQKVGLTERTERALFFTTDSLWIRGPFALLNCLC